MRPFRGSLEPPPWGCLMSPKDATPARGAQTDQNTNRPNNVPLVSPRLSPWLKAIMGCDVFVAQTLGKRGRLEGLLASAARPRLACVWPNTGESSLRRSLLSEQEVCGTTLLLREFYFPREAVSLFPVPGEQHNLFLYFWNKWFLPAKKRSLCNFCCNTVCFLI